MYRPHDRAVFSTNMIANAGAVLAAVACLLCTVAGLGLDLSDFPCVWNGTAGFVPTGSQVSQLAFDAAVVHGLEQAVAAEFPGFDLAQYRLLQADLWSVGCTLWRPATYAPSGYPVNVLHCFETRARVYLPGEGVAEDSVLVGGLVYAVLFQLARAGDTNVTVTAAPCTRPGEAFAGYGRDNYPLLPAPANNVFVAVPQACVVNASQVLSQTRLHSETGGNSLLGGVTTLFNLTFPGTLANRACFDATRFVPFSQQPPAVQLPALTPTAVRSLIGFYTQEDYRHADQINYDGDFIFTHVRLVRVGSTNAAADDDDDDPYYHVQVSGYHLSGATYVHQHRLYRFMSTQSPNGVEWIIVPTASGHWYAVLTDAEVDVYRAFTIQDPANGWVNASCRITEPPVNATIAPCDDPIFALHVGRRDRRCNESSFVRSMYNISMELIGINNGSECTTLEPHVRPCPPVACPSPLACPGRERPAYMVALVGVFSAVLVGAALAPVVRLVLRGGVYGWVARCLLRRTATED
jgi:hypothetical protein